jgi:hypothetical protein
MLIGPSSVNSRPIWNMGILTLIAAASLSACDSTTSSVEPSPEVLERSVGTVTLSPSSVTLSAGNERTFTATVRDLDGNVLEGEIVSWSSSHPSVASVQGSGTQALVTAVSPGSATVTASAAGKAVTSAVTVGTGLLFLADFQSGGFGPWNNIETCCDHSAKVVDNPLGGGKVLRVELRSSDPKVAAGPRAELTTIRNPAPNDFDNLFGGPGDEFWWGFRVLVPDEWVHEWADVVIQQVHAQPMLEEGEQWRSPPFSINIQDGRWRVWSRWDDDPITSGAFGKQNVWDAGPVQKGEWVDWIIHSRWSYQPSGHADDDGLLEVWRVTNGSTVKVVDYRGPTYYNDKRQGYLKLGIYKWPWNHGPTDVDRLLLYYDQIRVADGLGSFGLVAPR